MTFVATESVSGFFHQVVEDSLRVRKVSATDAATNYLVALLSDYAKPGELAEETLAQHSPLGNDDEDEEGEAESRQTVQTGE